MPVTVLVVNAIVNPAPVAPPVSVPVLVMLPCTVVGSVLANAATPEPLVARMSLLADAIAATVAPDELCASSALAEPETIEVVPMVILVAADEGAHVEPSVQAVPFTVTVVDNSPTTPLLSESTWPVPEPPEIVVVPTAMLVAAAVGE